MSRREYTPADRQRLSAIAARQVRKNGTYRFTKSNGRVRAKDLMPEEVFMPSGMDDFLESLDK